MSAQPYLAARPREGRQCLLCNEVFTPKERPQTIKLSGLITVKGKAELWAAINVPEEDTPYHEFTFVKERLGNISTECEGHEMCRMKFRTHVERKQKEYGGQEDAGDPMDEDMMQPELPTKTDVHQGKRLMRKVQQKAICFICNTQTPKDCNPYSDGGLGRCSDKRAVTKLEEKIKLTSPGDKYEDAVERFKLLLCGQAFDVFAVDVYYHKTCYTNFTRPTKSANKDVAKDEETQDELITRLKVIGNKVKTEFLALIERKVIKEKEAYLATDLLDEFGSLCTENGLEKGQSSITYTYELKRELQKRFGNAISFYLTGRKLIVHPTSVNPCLYATATLKGAGLRDDDVTRAFANMLRRRLVTETKQAWPITAEELIAKLNKCGPVDVLYNAIAWSINPNATKNESGYVVTSSKSLARKVWSVSSDWEALLTHERSTKSTALSLTVHRLTGSKEATTMLHKCGHGVSYSDVRLLNNTWAQQVTSQNSRKVPGRTSASKKGKSSIKDEIKAEITEQEPEKTPSTQSDDQEDEEISVKSKDKGRKPSKRGKVKAEITEQEPEKSPSSQSDDQEDEEISVKTKGRGRKPSKRGKVKEETTDSEEEQDEEPKRKRTKRAPAKPKGNQRAARGKKSMKESSTEPSEDDEIEEVKQVKKKVESPKKKNKKAEDTPVPRPTKYESLGDGPPPVPSTGRKYVGSHVSAAGGIWNAFENAEECSSKSFAIFLRNQRQWNAKPLDEETVEKWKEIGKDFPPHLILPHGSYLMNLGSPVPETLEKSRAMLVDELQRCQRLGIPHYNFHPGSTTGKISREECCKTIAESINLAHGQTKGVICVLENMSCQGFTIGGDFHELRLIIEHVKDKSRVGVCLDTCHSHAAGYDLSQEEGFEELLEDFEKIIGWQFLRGLHINDSKGQVGDHLDRHENIGKGTIGLEGFLRVMNCDHFNDLPLILETPWTSNAGYATEVKALTSLTSIEK